MMKEQQNKYIGNDSYLKLLLIQLFIIISRSYSSKAPIKNEYPSALHLHISKVSKYISEHFVDNLNLNILAKNFNMSTFYLSRNFKLATGLTFIGYLNNLRIKEAKRLLKETNIISISLAVGFQNTTHFGRIFKQITSTTPSKYRKE